MTKKLELQTILVLLCVLVIAGAWIGIQVARDSLGVWSEKAELHFTTRDLLGIAPRSQLQCAGGVIGHVRKVTPRLAPDGGAQFDIVAGVKREYADWRFEPVGIVKVGVVTALAASSITLELSPRPEAVQPRAPARGPVPVLSLVKERKDNDLNDVAAQYRKLGDRIDATIRQFTDPAPGRAKSVLQEFSESIPAVSSSLTQFETVMGSLSGRTAPTEGDPARRPPIERLLLNLDATTGNLKGVTATMQVQVGEGGKLDQTLTTLNASLLRLQTLTDEMTRTVANLNLKVDGSLRKVNGLLDETTGTMTTLHQKVEGFGGTFVGRMLIADKPKAAAPSTPTPPPRAARVKRAAP